MIVPSVFSPIFSASVPEIPRCPGGCYRRVILARTPLGLSFTVGLRDAVKAGHDVAGKQCQNMDCPVCMTRVTIDGVRVNDIINACLDDGVLCEQEFGDPDDALYAFTRPLGHSELEMFPAGYDGTGEFPAQARPKVMAAAWQRVPGPNQRMLTLVQFPNREGRDMHPSQRPVQIGLWVEAEGKTLEAFHLHMEASWLLTGLMHVGLLMPRGCDEDRSTRCTFVVRLPRDFVRAYAQ